ncbi:MAG: flotillin domain-containing protein [Deltaproteobacteria bacterium]|nr:flotillin domain-containing protein [Deltaproteobacteria bacterium]
MNQLEVFVAQGSALRFWEQPQFIVSALIASAVIFVFTLLLVTIARFYRRCGADEALVRTGAGGNKVVIGGGVTVFPILHQLMRVSLRSHKLTVDRSGNMALVTRDKIRATVTTELYIKVEPLEDDVLTAARSFGERNLDEGAIGDLIEGKLTDALRSVAANSSFMELHTNRKDFAESIQKALSEELKKNGLTLENVSITALAMVSIAELNASDFFDSEGLMTITEQVKANARKTNLIEREADVAIQEQNVTAHRRALELIEADNRNESDQTRRVQEYTATQSTATAKAVYEQQRDQEMAALSKEQAVQNAKIEQQKALQIAEAQRVAATREAQISSEKQQQVAVIAKEREVEAAMIEKQRTVENAEVEKRKTIETAEIEKVKTIEAAEIEKQRVIETARVSKQIAVTQALEVEARAEALKLQAEADRTQATQGILTVEATAQARREKEIAVIKSEESAQQARIAAEREAFVRKLGAETSAAAVKAEADGAAAAKRAQAEGHIAEAEGSARALMVAADSAANVVRAEAQADADRVRITAEARAKAAQLEAEALIALAEATRQKGAAEADARKALVDAENQVASKFLLRDIVLKALTVLPDVTKELMAPAHAIREIKVLQMNNGQGGSSGDVAGSGNGQGAFGAASPVLRTILEAGAAFPLLRELMQFAQVDTDRLTDSARKMLGALPEELRKVANEDPELAAKLAAMDANATGTIGVRAASDTAREAEGA